MTAPVPAAPIQPLPEKTNFYDTFMEESGSFLREGRLGVHNIKEMMLEHYQMIKRYDSKLFPIALAVSAAAMLCINALMTALFFAAGTVFAVWKGDQWKETLVKPLKAWWNDSDIAKVGLIAVLILFAAPLKWNLAAFGLGICTVQMIKKKNENPQNP